MAEDIKELEETKESQNESGFITEEQARGYINDEFTNFSGIMRVQSGYCQSGNYIEDTSGWKLDSDGTIYVANLVAYGGTVRYGKTSFTDTTNAGYILCSSGFYMGSASDAAYLKYTISSGALLIVGGSFQTSELGASSGRGVKIAGGTNKDIQFYYNDSLKSYMGGYIDADGEGENESLRIQSDATGRYIRLMESYIRCNGNFLPHSDNSGDSLGSSGHRWAETHSHVVVAAHYDAEDIIFQDEYCPICGEELKEGDFLVMYGYKKENGGLSTIPAHLKCIDKKVDKKTVDLNVKKSADAMEVKRLERVRRDNEKRMQKLEEIRSNQSQP